MLISMTGYAAKSFEISAQRFNLEIKSYNHKYLDIIIKIPKAYNYLENQIRKTIGEYVNRGRVEFVFTVEETNLERYINRDKAKIVHKLIDELRKSLNIKEDITLTHILYYKDFLLTNNEKLSLSGEFEELFWGKLSEVLKDFNKSRIKEGKELEKDIKKRLRFLEKNILKIEKMLPTIKNNNISKIKKRVFEVFEKANFAERLEQEILYITEKLDVSEEIIRFKTHLKNIQNIIKDNSQIGKKLDFYTQELLREINTLIVKSQDAEVSKIGVDIKSEIEKIREQVQNVE